MWILKQYCDANQRQLALFKGIFRFNDDEVISLDKSIYEISDSEILIFFILYNCYFSQ